jgi:type I restriction-modification system DNA methylase subunit
MAKKAKSTNTKDSSANLGFIDRVHRELTDTDLQKIVSTYHAWRGDRSRGG